METLTFILFADFRGPLLHLLFLERKLGFRGSLKLKFRGTLQRSRGRLKRVDARRDDERVDLHC